MKTYHVVYGTFDPDGCDDILDDDIEAESEDSARLIVKMRGARYISSVSEIKSLPKPIREVNGFGTSIKYYK